MLSRVNSNTYHRDKNLWCFYFCFAETKRMDTKGAREGWWDELGDWD